MDITWESYVGRRRFYNKISEPMIRINNRGCIFFNSCDQLIKDICSYGYIEILIGRSVNDEIIKIGFKFSNGLKSAKRLIHQKGVHYFSYRPFVHEFFPRIMIDSEITSLQFSPTIESNDTLSIPINSNTSI